MGRRVSLITLYAFMAKTEKSLPFTLVFSLQYYKVLEDSASLGCYAMLTGKLTS
jgi:hypothetical protein